MDTSGVLATVSIVLSFVGTAIAVINHKRIRSNCCRKEFVASIDIENTAPPTQQQSQPSQP